MPAPCPRKTAQAVKYSRSCRDYNGVPLRNTCKTACGIMV